MDIFNTHFIIASLIWSAIGGGFITYGRKAGEPIPAFGGLGIVAASWVSPSVLIMSLVSVGLLVAVYALNKLGYW